MGPRLLRIFLVFGQASGLQVNWSKSLLVPLRGDSSVVSWQAQMAVRRHSFPYPGVYIALLPELTWGLNLRPLMLKLSADLVNWSRLPLNVLGRVALFKMVALPRLLYAL